MALQSFLSLGLIFFLLASCSLTDFVKNISSAFSPPAPPPQVQNISPPVQNVSPPTPKIEQQWASITNDQAQKGCLRQAKKVATDQGYSESVVFTCICTANENDQFKNYACSISAIDGSHKVTIDCIKTQNQCVVTSEQGTQSYNFDQLETFING